MSVRSLSRRLDRTLQRAPVVDAPDLRAYVAFLAERHDLPVDELLRETEALLARAQQTATGRTGADLAEWLAAASGWSAEAIRAEAEASLAAWQEQR